MPAPKRGKTNPKAARGISVISLTEKSRAGANPNAGGNFFRRGVLVISRTGRSLSPVAFPSFGSAEVRGKSENFVSPVGLPSGTVRRSLSLLLFLVGKRDGREIRDRKRGRRQRGKNLGFQRKMEGEVGPQVAAPFFIHQALSGRFCEAASMTKKRDFPWQNGSFQQQQQQQFLQLQQQQQQLNSGFQNPNKNHWSNKSWEWDSVSFVAKPSTGDAGDVLRLGTAETEKKKKGEEAVKPAPVLAKSSTEEGGENLTLKLGGSSYSAEEAAGRPNKRVRSGSPGGGGNYPMCQVDDCKGDLTNAKDYHRRHKVCEFHSKTTKALVGQQMQRFCQQCSRFHPLFEFDEGKRSCRRRLAGHNRRRRKTQPEDASSRLLVPGSQENSSGGNLDIVNLLSILARVQGNNSNKTTGGPLILDKDQLIQILSKMNSLPVSMDSSMRLPLPGSLDLNVSHASQGSAEHLSQANGNPTAASSVDLFAVLSAALAAASPEALALLKRGSSENSGDDKSKVNFIERAACIDLEKKCSSFASPAVELSNGSYRSPLEVSECAVQESRPSLPLQLFSSSPEDDSLQKFGSSRKYFSSDSSNPIEERSPSSSPVEQKLFPLHSATEMPKPDRISDSRVDNGAIESSTSRGWSSGLELFRRPNARAENGGTASNLPYQAGYTSSSGSDHSPSSSNSDSQDRTGRIMFKLFDKDPSNFPGNLRTQIFNWLSHSPSEMESYIRPGCVVLSIYVSMPSVAWEQLQEDILQCVSFLVEDPISDFWRSGRKDSDVQILENMECPGVDVENGFKGNSFPLIIADAAICQELRTLEYEFGEDAKAVDVANREQIQDFGQPSSRENDLHFLNELGWLFQRITTSSNAPSVSLSCARLKFLFTFSVERDWSALVKTLLDVVVEWYSGADGSSREAVETLLEIHLLNRAVKRKCRKMVDFLLHYSVNKPSKIYLFPPNLAGPGGVTPLHLAACTQESLDMVDALTSDPDGIGLNCWNSLLDANGQTPYAYAMMRSNHSYNKLVARKLADRRNGEVSITVPSGEISIDQSWTDNPNPQALQPKACAICCAAAAMKQTRRMPGSQGLLHRPYIHSMLTIAAIPLMAVCGRLASLEREKTEKLARKEPIKWMGNAFSQK
ncbi:Squamosa promoter-binding-like protein, partial [Asimina triloba]